MRPVLVAVLACACNSTVLGDIQTQVVASPPLIDFGPVLVGSEQVEKVSLNAKNGLAKVLDVSVIETLATGFVYEGEPSFTIDLDDANGFEVVFRPDASGYASALLQITTDARPTVVEVAVRARGVTAGLVATPSFIDFGTVRGGTSAVEVVELLNGGPLDVEMTGFTSSMPDTSCAATFPFTVAAGDAIALPFSYYAQTEVSVVGRLAFQTGTATVDDVVVMRANNCDLGVPQAYDVDGDGVTSCGGDCEDGDETIGPGMPELPNGIDDDCDRVVDEGTTAYDDDGDGFCEGPTCYDGSRPGDCNDDAAGISPGAVEQDANGIDDDCNGVVDVGATDADHDGYSAAGGDCDETRASVHPGAVEVANGRDDDCDGLIDEGTAVYDDDGDGYCEGPTCIDGATPGDCADANPARHPGAAELPDSVDNDCDGQVDEGTVRGDDDHDGFTELGGDCDDNDPNVNPARGGCP